MDGKQGYHQGKRAGDSPTGTQPWRTGRKVRTLKGVLGEGTFALQGHDPGSTVLFRNLSREKTSRSIAYSMKPLAFLGRLGMASPCSSGCRRSNWPQWRGPDASGHAPLAGNFPEVLVNYPSKYLYGRRALPGRGHSSPVHSDKRENIWVTSAIETPASEKERAGKT